MTVRPTARKNLGTGKDSAVSYLRQPDHREVGKRRQFLLIEGYSDTEHSWVKEVDIDVEMGYGIL